MSRVVSQAGFNGSGNESASVRAKISWREALIIYVLSIERCVSLRVRLNSSVGGARRFTGRHASRWLWSRRMRVLSPKGLLYTIQLHVRPWPLMGVITRSDEALCEALDEDRAQDHAQF
jgi:hypothetical protein